MLGLVASVLCGPEVPLPGDCDDIYRHDNTTPSGVYAIYPGGPAAPLQVYCDMETDGGRWTVSTRRYVHALLLSLLIITPAFKLKRDQESD